MPQSSHSPTLAISTWEQFYSTAIAVGQACRSAKEFNGLAVPPAAALNLPFSVIVVMREVRFVKRNAAELSLLVAIALAVLTVVGLLISIQS